MQIDISTVQTLIQKSLNLMETAKKWESRAAKKALMCGLQGEKRRLRWLSREAGFAIDWTEQMAWGILKIDLCAQEGSVDVSGLLDTRSTTEGIIEKLWTIYSAARKLVNEFTIANFKDFAVPLDKYACKLFKIIGELQRYQSEYEMAKYEYHHISRYQVSLENVHDEYECEEEKQGYKDY